MKKWKEKSVILINILSVVVEVVTISKFQFISFSFPKYEVAFRYHKCITDGFIGNAPVQLCDAGMLKDIVELIFKNANGEDPLGTENPIPPKWYYNK